MLRSNALVTLEAVKLHLGLAPSNVAEDARLELFINAASAFIETYCSRRFKSQSYTELQSGRQNNYIVPLHFPITAISEIRISNTSAWSDAATLVSDEDYLISDYGTSIQLWFNVLHGYNNVRIIYTAGYTTLPSDLELAAMWAVEWYYRHRQRADMGKISTSKGDESIGILASMPPQITEILNGYKRLEMPLASNPIRNY